MKIFGQKSSFFYLNVTQFLVTINDSIFRLIVAYNLIDIVGVHETNRVLAILAALFVAPFLLFSMPAGEMADRFSKRSVILWTLWAELLFMFLGLIAFYVKDVYSSYSALFLIAFQSAVFNPSKYSIIPEIVEKNRISRVNGILTLTTYLSIIAGTFLASFLSDVTNRNYISIVYLCIFFSIVAIFTGLAIEKTPIQDPQKKVNKLFFIQVVKSLLIASRYKYLLLACVCSACFLFTASFTQLNLIPFGVQSLGITKIQTGYVYLAAALGLGFGSFLVATLSGRFVELGLSVLGGFGTAFCYFFLYSFSSSLVLSCLFFFLLGVSGGMFVVPLDAYIQVTSPDKKRGSVVAAATFLSYMAVLLASGYLYLIGDILQWKASQGFLSVSIGTALIVSFMAFRIKNSLYRAFCLTVARLFITVDSCDLIQGENIVVVTKYKKLCKLAITPLLHDQYVLTVNGNKLDKVKDICKKKENFCFITEKTEDFYSLQKEFGNIRMVTCKKVPAINGSFFHFCRIASIHLDFDRINT